MSAVFLFFSALLIRIFWPRMKPEIHWLCPVLSLALPFSAGGFHTGSTAVLSLFLALACWEQIRKNGSLQFFANRMVISVLVVFAAYCITPFWAADKGMAGFALPRYLPLLLYSLFLMQVSDDLGQQLLQWIPGCGCLMTILSFLASLFPAFYPYVTINGRLAGFFQYPNSFAAFLLVGLILHSFRIRRKADVFVSFLLMMGIVLSGSKTVFVLMLLFLSAILLKRRQLFPAMILGISLAIGLGVGFLANSLGLLSNADRFTDIHISSGTFLVRLLYFRDVIPYILSHPFGIGYMGYPAIEGLIQTGRYYVSFIHNGFLQLLLEIGWIPAVLMAFALLSAVLSSKTSLKNRFVLLAVLAHCMLDFDLQFSVFWIILLNCCNIHSGKQFSLKSHAVPRAAVAVLCAASLWLGCGDWLYRMEKPELCLKMVPFHTNALTYQMASSTDPGQIDETADRILAFNPTHTLALSAKANISFSKGDIPAMIEYKESAIRTAPYSTEEYCDYFRMLYTAMELYLKSGDTGSAAHCRNKLLQIPNMMAAVSQKTHVLAGMTGDDSSLMLPPDYNKLLETLR